MQGFKVIVTRSAVETAVLVVQANSQEWADMLISRKLDGPTRIDLNDLTSLPGVKLEGVSCSGDDESSWEVSC